MLISSDHWLFICSANYIRSPTAEYVARRKGLLATSCGAPPLAGSSHHFVCVPLSEALIEWADVIVCMETIHVERVKLHPVARMRRKIYCWNVPDDWGKPYDPQLVRILEQKLEDTLRVYAEGEKAGRPAS